MITIDLDKAKLTVEEKGKRASYALGTPEAFAVISKAWLRAGWDAKHVYSFTWLGRPIIQLPEDMFRVQEAIYAVRPTLIIETGVAHGGSLVFYASLLKAMGGGRVIGVDVEIRPHNRTMIEKHELSAMITLVEGSSTDPEVVDRVRNQVCPDDRVFVMLDSNHAKAHVLAELEAYGGLVSPGSYIVAADGIMGDLADAPRGRPDWSWNNPRAAAAEFVSRHSEFVLETPPFRFNEGMVSAPPTYWPGGWLKKRMV